MLQVDSVFKSFPTLNGSQPVLRGVSFDLAKGQSLALMGDSGCGKSTLLHCLSGLDAIESGTIRFDSTEVQSFGEEEWSALRIHKVGVIFQHFNLITSLDVASNIAFHARLKGDYDAGLAEDIAKRLGVSDLLSRMPEELSGGQQQRVAIARTLVARPKLILADEPTGNLDEETSDTVLELALELVRDLDLSFLMVTHSGRMARALDRQLRLRAGVVEAMS